MKLQTKWSFFYWNELKQNNGKETLRECIDKYGLGVTYCKSRNIVVAVIFLSSERNFAHCWLLGVKHFRCHNQCLSHTYENNKYTYHMSPKTNLGKKILGLLSQTKVRPPFRTTPAQSV